MQNRAYSARLDRQLISDSFYEGARNLNSWVVTAGGGMSVDVSIGEGYVDGDDQPNQGTYFVESDAIENVSVGAAPGADSRIDLLVLQIRDPNAGGPAGDDAVFEIVPGTPSGTPTVPALPLSALPIATILVAAGTATITNGMITRICPVAGRKMPAGFLELYSGPVATIPNGWLVCDGAAEVRDDYPNLDAIYELAGYPYGAGDTITTFNKPDLRERVPLAVGPTLTTVGATGGAASITLAITNLPAHSHTVNSHSHTIAHNHTIDHNHASFNTASGGAHVHTVDGGNPRYTHFVGSGGTANASAGDDYFSNFMDSSGAHIHAIDVPAYAGPSGPASAANSGPASPGTSSVGSGTAISVRNPYQMITAWLVCVG